MDKEFWSEVWQQWKENVTGTFSGLSFALLFLVSMWSLFFEEDSSKISSKISFGITGVLIVLAFLNAVQKVWRKKHDELMTLRGKLNKFNTNDGVPDWTIRELFFYIRPDLVEDHKDNTWEKVGLAIRDKLSTGQLKIWGRLDAKERMPLSEISREYWQNAEFTYWFLSDEDGAQFLVHATPYRQHAGLPQYRDLQVSKTQAKTIWIESKDKALLRLTHLRSDGVALRNEAEYVQDASLQPWLENIEKWMFEVIGAIQQISEADSEWFKILDTVPPPRIPIKSLCKEQRNPSIHLSVYRQHDLRLVRLGELLKKYGVAP